jgi:hypothetical protein
MTLEPAISTRQTEQIRSERVQLVVPAAIQSSYRDQQRQWLMSIADFLTLVANR